MRKYQKSCSKLIWPFYSLLQLFEQKCHRSHISASSVHKYQKYLLKFCEQVSQIVSSADLTILRLITTVWAKMSQNSYLLEFCEQVSEFLFLALLTFLRLITTVSAKMSQDS